MGLCDGLGVIAAGDGDFAKRELGDAPIPHALTITIEKAMPASFPILEG